MRRQNSIFNSEDDLLSLLTETITLAPAQQRVADRLLASASKGNVCLLEAGAGMGKTSILRWLHARLGGAFVAARQWVASRNAGTARTASILFIDDLQLVTAASEVESAVAARRNNTLVISLTRGKAGALRRQAVMQTMKPFQPDDYSRICRRYLGDAAGYLDMAEIHRNAPGLNAYDLKHACLRLGLRYEAPSTGAFLRAL